MKAAYVAPASLAGEIQTAFAPKTFFLSFQGHITAVKRRTFWHIHRPQTWRAHQFANKAFSNITSTNWKAQRSENRVLGGIPQHFIPMKAFDYFLHAVKNWFYLTKIQAVIHLHFKINQNHENSNFCLECNNQCCYIGLRQLHFRAERFHAVSKHLYFWQIHLLWGFRKTLRNGSWSAFVTFRTPGWGSAQALSPKIKNIKISKVWVYWTHASSTPVLSLTMVFSHNLKKVLFFFPPPA